MCKMKNAKRDQACYLSSFFKKKKKSKDLLHIRFWIGFYHRLFLFLNECFIDCYFVFHLIIKTKKYCLPLHLFIL